MTRARIAVAMSGGVDSSVAAAILSEQGADVFGIMLRLWTPSDEVPNRCCSPADVARATRVAASLDIPLYVLDARDAFKRHVVDPFIDGYAQGLTPNPCLQCNRHIRWGYLLRRALAFGATHLATGHYARLRHTSQGVTLLRGLDKLKDQSYFLSLLQQHQLQHAVFPLGDLTKPEVRNHAHFLNLEVAGRPESQDLCFVPDGSYRQFLVAQGASLPPPGPILDTQGNQLGRHTGLADFTIGQRKGIGISAARPLYVVRKDLATNSLIVGHTEDLGSRRFSLVQVNWVLGKPPSFPLHCSVKIRYKADEVDAEVTPASPDSIHVLLDRSLPGVTPGQAAVFYSQDTCLGGGIIQP